MKERRLVTNPKKNFLIKAIIKGTSKINKFK